MAVRRCENGKWRVGEGQCIYSSKKAAQEAQKVFLEKENKRWKKSQKKNYSK